MFCCYGPLVWDSLYIYIFSITNYKSSLIFVFLCYQGIDFQCSLWLMHQNGLTLGSLLRSFLQQLKMSLKMLPAFSSASHLHRGKRQYSVLTLNSTRHCVCLHHICQLMKVIIYFTAGKKCRGSLRVYLALLIRKQTEKRRQSRLVLLISPDLYF